MGINLNHQTETISTGSAILKQSDVGGIIVANGDGMTQKPAASGNNGLIRYNTTTGRLEAVINNAYYNLSISTDLASYLQLSGGSMTGTIGLSVGSASLPSLAFATDTTTGLYQPASGVLGITTNGNERMRIDSAGNIGIGTVSTSIYRLSVIQSNRNQIYVGSTGANDSTIVIDNAAGSKNCQINFSDTGTIKWNLYKTTANGFSLTDAVASKTFLSATSGGNLTLGPAQNVSISQTGQLSVIQAGNSQAYFGSTGVNTSQIIIDNASGSNECDVTYSDAGSQKWSVLKSSTNSFSIYDRVANKSFLSAVTGGNLTLGPAQNFVIDQSGNTSVASTLTVSGALSVPGTVSGAGFINYLASPPSIGSTIPGAASFSALAVNNNSLYINQPTASNDTATYSVNAFVGSDATLGSLTVRLGAYPSATASQRFAFLGAGDNVTIRNLALSTNGIGSFGSVSIGSIFANSGDKLTVTGNASVSGKLSNKQTAKAWVNFDGTASGTITPRANYNVSSVTKNGSGDYTLNFTSALADTNYVVGGSTDYISGSLRPGTVGASVRNTTSVEIFTANTISNGTQYWGDCTFINIFVFGN